MVNQRSAASEKLDASLNQADTSVEFGGLKMQNDFVPWSTSFGEIPMPATHDPLQALLEKGIQWAFPPIVPITAVGNYLAIQPTTTDTGRKIIAVGLGLAATYGLLLLSQKLFGED